MSENKLKRSAFYATRLSYDFWCRIRSVEFATGVRKPAGGGMGRIDDALAAKRAELK